MKKRTEKQNFDDVLAELTCLPNQVSLGPASITFDSQDPAGQKTSSSGYSYTISAGSGGASNLWGQYTTTPGYTFTPQPTMPIETIAQLRGEIEGLRQAVEMLRQEVRDRLEGIELAELRGIYKELTTD
jgi:hypothetical protein